MIPWSSCLLAGAEKAQAILARADDMPRIGSFAECTSARYRSRQSLGTAIALQLMQNAVFKVDLRRTAMELAHGPF